MQGKPKHQRPELTTFTIELLTSAFNYHPSPSHILEVAGRIYACACPDDSGHPRLSLRYAIGVISVLSLNTVHNNDSEVSPYC